MYQRALTLFGTTKIPINTFNKVWIVPDTAIVYQDDTRAIIGDTHLKVMLEEDYLALSHLPLAISQKSQKGQGLRANSQELNKEINTFTSQITKELILPRIEEDVNYGKNFTYLRQIYSSLILATWFKQKLKESILSKIYVDQKKIKGVDVSDPQIKQKIYKQYLEAYKKGVYNYIKSDYDPSSRKNIRRKYYSGGFTGQNVNSALKLRPLLKRWSTLTKGLCIASIVLSVFSLDVSANESKGEAGLLKSKHLQADTLHLKRVVLEEYGYPEAYNTNVLSRHPKNYIYLNNKDIPFKEPYTWSVDQRYLDKNTSDKNLYTPEYGIICWELVDRNTGNEQIFWRDRLYTVIIKDASSKIHTNKGRTGLEVIYNTPLNSDHWLRYKNVVKSHKPGGQKDEEEKVPQGV